MADFPVGVAALAQALAAQQLSSVAATKHYLAQIAVRDGELNSFILVTEEQALQQANAADVRRSQGQCLGPLDGMPIAIKDNIDIAGLATTAGIAARRNAIAQSNAAVIDYLLAAGAVLLGKTNLHEAALGTITDNPHFGFCYNPHRAGYTPGGSSGGSAAAVAAGLCAAALGTDTMGSVRLPAAYCGCFGHKPTTGLVSNRGVVPLSWTLDHVGPIAPCAEDLRLLMQVLARFDAEDPNARAAKQSNVRPFCGLKIGCIAGLKQLVELEPDVAAGFYAAVAKIRHYGAEIIDVSLGDYDFGRLRRAGLLLTEAEAAVVHAEGLAENPEGYSETLRAMLAWGQSQSAQRLAAAQRQLLDVVVLARRIFAQVDVLITPTTPQTAFSFEQKTPANQADLTSFANLARCPAVSIPIGVDSEGLPIGMQIVGPEFSDQQIIQLAMEFQGQ